MPSGLISSADEVFREAAKRGLVLCNLFQLPPENETWRANFIGHPFGEAETPQEALALALDAATKNSRPRLTAEDMDLLG